MPAADTRANTQEPSSGRGRRRPWTGQRAASGDEFSLGQAVKGVGMCEWCGLEFVGNEDL